MIVARQGEIGRNVEKRKMMMMILMMILMMGIVMLECLSVCRCSLLLVVDLTVMMDSHVGSEIRAR